MALIICPECGKKISDTAKACVCCGYQLTTKDNSFNSFLDKSNNITNEKVIVKRIDKAKQWISSHKIVSVIMISVLLVVILFCAIGLPIILSNNSSNQFDIQEPDNSKIKITSISIQSAGNISKIKAGDSLQFSIKISPSNATFTNLNYKIVKGSDNATLSKSGLLVVSSNATVKAIIELQAVVDNISSNIFQIEVINDSLKTDELNNEKSNLLLEKSLLESNNRLNQINITTNLGIIQQWETDLVAANKKLDAIYAERSVRMYIGGQWIWTYDTVQASQQEKVVEDIQANIDNVKVANSVYQNNIVSNNARIVEIDNKIKEIDEELSKV